MHRYRIALLRLALAVDGDRHIDFEVLGGNHANGGRGEDGKK